jgi:hypothetical protein
MLVALLALVMATTGSAVAASLITSAQIKDGTIQTKDISKKAQAALKGKAGAAGAQGAQGPQGVTGPAGVKGDNGDKGDTGTPATKLFVVHDGTATVVLQSGVVSVTHTANGRYAVKFNQSVANCVWITSVGGRANGTLTGATASVNGGPATPADTVRVATFYNGGDADEQFNLAVLC